MSRFATDDAFCRAAFGRASTFLSSVYTQYAAAAIRQTRSTDAFAALPPLTCVTYGQTGHLAAPILVALAPAAATAVSSDDVASVSSGFAADRDARYTGFPTPAHLTAGVFHVEFGTVDQVHPDRGQAIPNTDGHGGIAVVYRGAHAWWCVWYMDLPVSVMEIARAEEWMAMSDTHLLP